MKPKIKKPGGELMGKIFGTDGIRGKANKYPITPELALRLGKAIAKTFHKEKVKSLRHSVVIGKDTRLSGYMLETALTSGLVSMGSNVLLVGPMPTPAIAHLTKSLNADAGIVLSASHNPSEDNGIKIFNHEGLKLSDKREAEIETLLEHDIEAEHVLGTDLGKAFRVDDAKGRYIEFLKSTINNTPLTGLKIVLDCANGAAYNIAPKVFAELGAEVITICDEPDGLNINLNCGATNPLVMQEEVKKQKADIGISLDGDADRIFIADENGEAIDGDKIIAICALNLKENSKLSKNTIVVTVMSNTGLDKSLKEQGIEVIRTKVGDRYVLEELLKSGYNLGGEQSGHIIFGDYSTTGDGILTGLQFISIMKKTGKKPSELAKCVKCFPQVQKSIKIRQKKPIEELEVCKLIDNCKSLLGEKGRVLARYSGTEPVVRVLVEGEDESQIEKMLNEIADGFEKEVGA